jgi:hypothetical protein
LALGPQLESVTVKANVYALQGWGYVAERRSSLKEGLEPVDRMLAAGLLLLVVVVVIVTTKSRCPLQSQGVLR